MNTDKRFESVKISKTFNRIVSHFSLNNKKVLDLGCGHGEHLALFGKGSVGITINKDEALEGEKKGLFIVVGNIEEIGNISIPEKMEIIWANNFFEHILSPHSFLMNLKKHADKNTTLILGVPVFPFPKTLLLLERFRGALATNHINFFTRATLMETVSRAGWSVSEARPFLFHNKFLDRVVSFFAPHIYIVAKNNEAFLYPPKKLMEWKGVSYYKELLDITKQS